MPDPFEAVRSSLTRRDLLTLAARGTAAVAVAPSLLACGVARGASARSDVVTDARLPAGSAHAAAAASRSTLCVLTAALTEGPYFVDEHLHRSDIRADPHTGVVAGVPLALRFHVSRVADAACTPLTGAYLDVWHADPAGNYSDIAPGRGGPPLGPPPGPPPNGGPGRRPGPRPGGPPPGAPPFGRGPRGDGPPGTNTAGQKFLRGYQITDGDGVARFDTVYPGWYPGRAVHIHFKLRLFAGATTRYEFTSQFFFDDALTDAVHARAPYDARGQRDMRNASDDIYASLTPAERGALTLESARGADGYSGVIALGVQVR